MAENGDSRLSSRFMWLLLPQRWTRHFPPWNLNKWFSYTFSCINGCRRWRIRSWWRHHNWGKLDNNSGPRCSSSSLIQTVIHQDILKIKSVFFFFSFCTRHRTNDPRKLVSSRHCQLLQLFPSLWFLFIPLFCLLPTVPREDRRRYSASCLRFTPPPHPSFHRDLTCENPQWCQHH